MKVVYFALASLATVYSRAGLSGTVGAHDLVVFETVPNVHSSVWNQGRPASGHAILDLHILLNHARRSELNQLILDIATPGHSEFGNFLSREQLKEYHQPSENALSDTKAWLEHNNISSDAYQIVHFGDQINLRISVKEAEALFDTTFYEFTREGQSHGIVRAKEYSLPKYLHEHISTIVPVVRLPEISAQASMILDVVEAPQQPPSLAYDPIYCNLSMTPACIQGLYQMNNFTAPLNKGILLGISGFLNQTVRLDDLHNFIAYYAPGVAQPFPDFITTDKSASGDAATAGSMDTVEASLDVQYAAALAPGIPITFYSTAGPAPNAIPDVDQPDSATMQNEPFLAQLNYLLSLPDEQLPSVLSTSYGENEQTVPGQYAYDICSRIGSLGARGVSVIFSSGDEGPGSGCVKNDGSNATFYNAIFPASCPYVTAVGGTTGVEPERAASFSSGGFSAYFAAQAYQNKTMEAFLAKNGQNNQGLFYSRGRGFPDVSVQAANVRIRDHGFDQSVSGTSASAPIFAGMIANLNALRISQGLPKLGFLNPWLYNNATFAFTDITVGRSEGCTGTSIYGHPGAYVPNAGWDAVEGWDPVTGLGTPIWPKLVELSNAHKKQGMPPNNATDPAVDVEPAGTSSPRLA